MKLFFDRQKKYLIAPISLSKIYIFLSLVLLTITLLPLFMLCMYNHPSTFDDFVVFNARKNGYSYYETLKIGLRYAIFPGMFLINFSKEPTIFEIQHMLIFYRLYSVFFILFFSFSVFFALKQCNTYFLKIKRAAFFLFYSVVLFFLINNIRYFAYFFYDIILTAGYTYGICLILLFLGFFIKYHFAQKKKGYAAVLFLLAFIINGTMEYYPVLLGFILFVYLVAMKIKIKQNNLFILFLFFLCFITALSYIFSPSVTGKLNGNLPGVQNPYSVERFSRWFIDTVLYFLHNFSNYLSFKILPLLITVSLVAAKKLNKCGYRIHGVYLLFPYFIIFVMSFSLFVSGVTYIRQKISSVVIFNLMLAIHIFPICIYVFQRYCFPVSKKIVWDFVNKYDIKEHIKKIAEAFRSEFYVYRHITVIIISIIIIVYIGFIGIYKAGLPTRHAWKEFLKGTAVEYDRQISQIYKTLIESPEKNIIMEEPRTIALTLAVDTIWSVGDYSGAVQNISICIAPFFDKNDITIISSVDKD